MPKTREQMQAIQRANATAGMLSGKPKGKPRVDADGWTEDEEKGTRWKGVPILPSPITSRRG